MSEFLSKALSGLEEYVPGEQPQDKKYIKLNTNESPYPPSKKVIDAVSDSEVADLRLYCDPDCKKLKNALAELYCVKEDNIFLSKKHQFTNFSSKIRSNHIHNFIFFKFIHIII